MKRTALVLPSLAVAFMATVSAPSFASEWTFDDNGGSISVSGPTLTLTDSVDDGRFVSAEYKFNDGMNSGGLANKRGFNTTVSVTEQTDITNAKICRSNPFPVPMDCGRWKF